MCQCCAHYQAVSNMYSKAFLSHHLQYRRNHVITWSGVKWSLQNSHKLSTSLSYRSLISSCKVPILFGHDSNILRSFTFTQCSIVHLNTVFLSFAEFWILNKIILLTDVVLDLSVNAHFHHRLCP